MNNSTRYRNLKRRLNEYIDPPDLEDYQWQLVNNIKHIIQSNYFRKRPHIRILDSGCDTTGRQLWYLSNLTTGGIYGINNARDFPNDSSEKYTRKNVTILNMNGMDLKFPDQSFDMVISANVMEHVGDPEKYIRECCRTLKNNGIAYFEACPIWTSARGHHIHDDMVAKNCPDENNYRNDGSVIPDWSHLILSKTEMRSLLETKLKPGTCEYILNYLYRSNNLNRKGWREIKSELEGVFTEVKTSTYLVREPDNNPKFKDGLEDHDVFGFSAVCRRKQQNHISKRLILLLRRLGL